MMTPSESEKHWTEKAAALLVGAKIETVRYMTAQEAEDFGWQSRPLVMFLDSGHAVLAQSDDEGNDGGALIVGNAAFPVLRSP